MSSGNGTPLAYIRARPAIALLALAQAACSAARDRSAQPSRLRDAGEDASAGLRDAGAARVEPPAIPVGLDAYRQWDAMYRIRLGTRTYMRSTHDRAGGNEGADASHFLRQTADAFVTLDVQGPGIVHFVRTNHWHGSPWRYGVDGVDFIVTESSTADPLHPVEGSVFMPEAAFPSPLAYTWSTTRGADLSWVPIDFRERFTLGYTRTHYGTGYYIYQSFPQGARNLSQPLRSFAAEAPGADVLALLGRAGEDIAQAGPDAETQAGSVELSAGASVELATLTGPRTLVALKLRLPSAAALAADGGRLQITFDDQGSPAVDAPLPLFFGTGTFFNRSGAEWLVRGLLMNVRFAPEQVELASYFPMPFQSQARIELKGGDRAVGDVGYELRSVPYRDSPEWATHFHATYRDHGPAPTYGQDLVLLDTEAEPGGADGFCGSFVGTSIVFSEQGNLTTLEGDPRFFFDDSVTPQAHGTGTEEWNGGGDYWGGQTMTLPLAGHPVGVALPLLALAPEDLIESAYRLLIADAMPFGKNARIQLEHGGENDSLERYRTLVYWYGRAGACLLQTDRLAVGDLEDERRHDYSSPTSVPVSFVSSFELGSDDATFNGRTMTGTTELTLALRPDNFGALLRRTLDYALLDQRAEVFVAADDGRDTWQPAGIWYTAGSNRCVYSNPPGELDPPVPVLQTSVHRVRQDEFLIDRALTEGRERIRVRIVFAPERLPLAPGEPLPELAWSELEYTAYVWVLPRR